jgi:hypothetical protein
LLIEIFWYKVDTIVLKDNSKQQKQLFLELAGINGGKTISYTEVTDVIAEGTAIQRLVHQSKSFRQCLEVNSVQSLFCSNTEINNNKFSNIHQFCQIFFAFFKHFLM